jgi:uncharacterized membrane protein
MATLSVLKFNDPYGAERVMVALQGMQERELITLEDAAIVSWPQGNRKPKTRELHGGSAGWGAFWGFLIGMARRSAGCQVRCRTWASTTTLSNRFARR